MPLDVVKATQGVCIFMGCCIILYFNHFNKKRVISVYEIDSNQDTENYFSPKGTIGAMKSEHLHNQTWGQVSKQATKTDLPKFLSISTRSQWKSNIAFNDNKRRTNINLRNTHPQLISNTTSSALISRAQPIVKHPVFQYVLNNKTKCFLPGLSNSHVRRPGLTDFSPGLVPFALNKSHGLARPYLSFY